MTKSNMETLAMEIYEWCKMSAAWEDCAIYFDGKAIASWDTWHGVKGIEIADNLYEYEDKNPLDYFEYANPDTLSMSFEGPLYHILNDFGCSYPLAFESFCKLFDKHGYYFELGHAWNLTACEL